MKSNLSSLKAWRAEEIAKIFLLKSDYKMSIEKYPTPLFDFFVTLKSSPQVQFAIEVKTTVNFQSGIKEQLAKLKIYRNVGMIEVPVLLFRIDEKEESGKLDFLIAPIADNKLLIQNEFHFEELNQDSLKVKIKAIVNWYKAKVAASPDAGL
ncbi:hypothetical protein [Chryseolinea soli]|uniref:DUF4365 domain-containing protein n=1 Tax=Chryseolinea soli TaxID=2321403 RepID=A0A385STF0_9BACT|nr:hypothetical protein [Chryseolinea soli]AYB34479.1 hypothetical protein D4L85_29595 [Chryseolinea soli]